MDDTEGPSGGTVGYCVWNSARRPVLDPAVQRKEAPSRVQVHHHLLLRRPRDVRESQGNRCFTFQSYINARTFLFVA